MSIGVGQLWRVAYTIGDSEPMSAFVSLNNDCTSLTPLVLDGLGFVLFTYNDIGHREPRAKLNIVAAQWLGEVIS